MLDHEVHGRVHERLIQLVENIPAVDTFPAESRLFRVFNEEENEDKDKNLKRKNLSSL
jgi:hypothetical protein